MTDPEGTVVLVAVVIAPTVRPALMIAFAAAACVTPTTFGTGTRPCDAFAARISTPAKFQRSLDGERSLSVATVPAFATGAFSDWTQKVWFVPKSTH